MGHITVPENRKATRRPLRYRVCVADLEGHRLGLCLVADISETGARLKQPLLDAAGQPIGVPDEFLLILAQRGVSHRLCKTVWRNEQFVGVQFAGSGKRSRTGTAGPA